MYYIFLSVFFYLPPTFLNRLLTDLRQIWHECLTMNKICGRLRKNWSRRPKYIEKYIVIFSLRRQVFARSEEAVKYFKPSHRDCHLECCTFQQMSLQLFKSFRVSQSSRSIERRKRPDFEGNCSPNRWNYDINFYDVSKLACAYRRRWSDMTPNDLEPIIYYIVVKFPTITIPPPVNLFHSNLSKPILCRNATLMTAPELQKFCFQIIFLNLRQFAI